MGSSYARMMLRIVSLRIDDVGGPADVDRVARGQAPGQLRERVDALVAAGGPPVPEDDDVPRRAGVERARELATQGADDRLAGVVKEVKVVEEARGLGQPQAEGGVHAAVRRGE